MDTLKCIVSKANSIRFAERNNNLPSFDNRLSFEETWYNLPTIFFKQIFFRNDTVLLQVKAGLTATVVVTRYTNQDSGVAMVATGTTVYTDFIIYDYVLPLTKLECHKFTVESEESKWMSENTIVVDERTGYQLIQWSNQDPLTSSFEFDYTTVAAQANVNFMRLRGQAFEYAPAGEMNIYNNQNEVVKLKSDLFRNLSLKLETVPRQIAEVVTIALQHDLLLVNDVGYVTESLPEISFLRGGAQLTIPLTLQDSLGLNTHDIGFTCP